MLGENLILNQIIKNVYYREKVFTFLKPSFFEENPNKRLFKVIHKLFDEKVSVLDKSTLLISYNDEPFISSILELEFPNENIDWLITETEKWARSQALNNAVMKAADILVENKEVESIEGLIQEALAVSFDKDMGLDYVNDIEKRFANYGKDEKVYPTGYKLLDFHTNGGLRSKTLSVIMAPSNLGKSVVMCNLSCGLNAAGFNGIYLTLELDENVVGRRCDSINTHIPYFSLLQNKEKAFRFFKSYKGGQLYIKMYLPSRASCINIRTYLKELEVFKKFKTDFLVVDYLNLMRPNGSKFSDNMYEYYKQIAEQLRELAIELDIPVITATQVGRDAYNTGSIGMENVRGSMGIMETSDLVIAMTQTEPQAPENLITWKIVKNRLGRRNGKIETQFNPETLVTTEIITNEDKEMMSKEKSDFSITESDQKENEELLTQFLKDSDESKNNFSSFS